MRIVELRPGMEGVDLKVRIINLKNPRRVKTARGLEHLLVEGEVEDETGRELLNVWNESIGQLEGVGEGSIVELRNCFITSFQGVIHINVGRESEIRLVEK